MSAPVLFSTTLTPITCGVCSIPFALPADRLRDLQATGAWFWCPNGHQVHYLKTENQVLREKVERLERAESFERSRAESEARRATAYKGHATRLRNRVAKGKCPCCSRKFADVEQHIAEAHPGYGREGEE